MSNRQALAEIDAVAKGDESPTQTRQRDFAPPRWAAERVSWRQAINDRGVQAASWLAVMLHRLLGQGKDHFGILMYHRIAPVTPNLPPPSINVTPERFAAQMRGLLRSGASFQPLSRVLDAVRSGEPLRERTVVVTFDDGFQSVYDHAVPVLRELNIPATIFLNTRFIGSAEAMPFDHWGKKVVGQAPAEHYRAMTWDMCRDVLASGLIELGAHTHSHQDFRGRVTEFRDDLQRNLNELQQQLGIESPTFAFPYGTPRQGFASQALTTEARQLGVRCALNTRHEVVHPLRDPFTWGRINVFDWDTPATLKAKLAGWYGWIPAQRSRLERWLGKNDPANDIVQIPSQAPLLPRRDGKPSLIEIGPNDMPNRTLDTSPTAPADATTNPAISVIMPTFNRAHWVGGALESLAAQETDGRFEYEIVVIDNRSSDNTREVVERFAESSPVPVRYVHETSPGDAPTRNAGLRQARGDWFAFFDDDQFADPRWLVELWDAAQTCQARVLGGPVLLDLSDEELRRLGPVCRAVLREISFYDRLQPYQGKDLPGAGNAFVARQVMETVGCFDESMSMGGSDSDFFLRARQAGYPMWYAPQAKIRHRIAKSRVTPSFFRWESLSGAPGTPPISTSRNSACWDNSP